MSDETETLETPDELEEAVEVSFVIDGWNYRATYATDGTVGQIRVFLDDEEIADAGDRWSRGAPNFDPETLEETAREGLARVYAAIGAPMARGAAFTEAMRERFAPAATPSDVDEEMQVLTTTSVVLADGRTLQLSWSESADGAVGVASASHDGRFAFDDVWRDGKAGITWEADNLHDWALQRVDGGR